MAHYAGILEGSGKVWSIRVPDLPGCHGGGKSPDAAITDTISAMREWAQTIASDGAAIPAARGVQAIMKESDVEYDAAAGESIVMLPLLIDLGRPAKANISLDAGMLEAIDAEAALRGMTRSAFMVGAAYDKITSRS